MGPEFMLSLMSAQSTQTMMKSMMDNTIDEDARVDAFANFCERMDIDMSTLVGDDKRMRQVMRMYKQVIRSSK